MFRGLAALGFAIAWCGATAPVFAQNTNGALVVVIRAGFDAESGESIPKSRVVEAVTATLKTMMQEQPDDAITKLVEKFSGKTGADAVKNITATDFHAYKRLVNPDSPLPSLPTRKSEQLELRQLPALTPTWELTLLGATPRQIDQLDLTFINDAAQTKALTLKPSLKAEDSLKMTQLGTYALSLGKPLLDQLASEDNADNNWKVSEYSATVSTLDMKTEVVKGNWIEADSYYLIRLDGIDQHRDLFANIIRDRTKVGGVALDVFNVGESATLALGEAGVTDDSAGDTFEDNKISMTIASLSKTDCARAWVLFPLTKEQAERETKRLNQMSLGQIPDEIRKATPVMAGSDAVIKPGESARWFEWPKVGAAAATGPSPQNSFQRDIYLVDVDGTRATAADYQQLLKDIPDAYRVVVYEFENATGTVRNSPAYTTRGDAGEKKKKQPANSSEFTRWKSKLPELAKPAN